MKEPKDASTRLSQPDVDAFWSLVEPFDRGLRSLAHRLTGDRDLMDDVIQAAYLKAFRAGRAKS